MNGGEALRDGVKGVRDARRFNSGYSIDGPLGDGDGFVHLAALHEVVGKSDQIPPVGELFGRQREDEGVVDRRVGEGLELGDLAPSPPGVCGLRGRVVRAGEQRRALLGPV